MQSPEFWKVWNWDFLFNDFDDDDDEYNPKDNRKDVYAFLFYFGIGATIHTTPDIEWSLVYDFFKCKKLIFL